MSFPSTQFEMPERFNAEELSDRCWHVWRTSAQGDGDVELVYHDIASGIILLSIDLSCSELPAFNPVGSHVLTLNWCAQGRCEVDFGKRGSAVVDAGLLCVSTTIAGAFAYPVGPYRGFEYFVDLDQLDADTEALFSRFGVDLGILGNRLCAAPPAFTTKPSGVFAHAVEAISELLARREPDCNLLLASTCQLFASLNEVDPSAGRITTAYLQRSQRDLARKLRASIDANPMAVGLLSDIAASSGVGEASVRSYFARMYGTTPAAYARRSVLRRAAEMLAGDDVSVSDVALACGYSNPSKFSAAFRREFGANPVEYRRRKRLEHMKDGLA